MKSFKNFVESHLLKIPHKKEDCLLECGICRGNAHASNPLASVHPLVIRASNLNAFKLGIGFYSSDYANLELSSYEYIWPGRKKGILIHSYFFIGICFCQ